MKICVAGEGIWDVGRARNGDNGTEYAGDIPLILARIVRDELGRKRRFGFEGWTQDDLPRVHPPTANGWPRRPAEATARQLLAALWMACERNEFDALVFVRDSRLRDHEDRARACRKVIRAFNDRGTRLLVVLGLAVQEIEAWLVADPHSRKDAFGNAGTNRECAAPEELTDPKHCWQTMLGEATQGEADNARNAESRTRAIDAMRPSIVRDLCPLGFGPFQSEVIGGIVPRLHPGHARPGAGGT